MPVSILIVDDDPVQRRLLSAAVERMGHTPATAADGPSALALLHDGPADYGLVILDLLMPGMDGLTVLRTMRERGLETPVIVQTAQGGIDTVIAAMRAGAFDFVVKPASHDRLGAAVAAALKVEAQDNATRRARRAEVPSTSFDDLSSASPAMGEVVALARKATDSMIPILIEGESGVGKELVARAIQAAGPRADKPFVTVNCGAIPDNLVESILFGHEKGAFTGATDKHVGKFTEADGGTLFLDEIGELPLDVQVKLLRAVQQGEVDPVGARASRRVDIRLISATNRDLLERVREGRFRDDLYYRLNVFPITVPPLRERRDDIPGLARRFVARFLADEGRGRKLSLSPRAVAMLQAYDWPGNVRQLENAIFRAVVLAEGPAIDVEQFPQIRAQVDGIDLSEHLPARNRVTQPAQRTEDPAGTLRALDARGEVRSLAEIEHELIVFAIDRYGGQMSEVARRLGIGRSTLYRKLKDYGIDPGDGRGQRAS